MQGAMARGRGKVRSLRTQVALGLSLLGMLLALALGATLERAASASMEEQIGDSLYELSWQMQERLDRTMFERWRDIRVASSIEQIAAGDVPLDEKRRLLDRLKETYPHYAWIGLTNLSGQVIVSTDKVLEGQSVAARPWFKGARRGAYVGDVHKAMLDGLLNPSEQGALSYVDVAAPVLSPQGELIGVLGAHLSWSWARQVEQSVLAPRENRDTIEVIVVGRSGEVLLSPASLRDARLDVEAMQIGGAGEPKWSEMDWPGGASYLTAHARSDGHEGYPGLGWSVVVREPSASALAPVDSLRRQMLASGVALVAVFFGIGWVVSGRLTRQMRQMASLAEQISGGNLEIPPPPMGGTIETRRLSEALSELIKSLQRNEALRRDRDEAKSANQAKNAILAHISHDLRTPLNGILGYARLLATDPTLTEAQRRSLGTIERNGDHLLALINDLLDLSRIDSGQLNLDFAPIRLPVAMADLQAQFTPRARERGLSFELHVERGVPDVVLCDRLRLDQILNNLLGNAIKFTERGSVELRISHAAGATTFDVQDTGPGIAAEDLDRIFDPFTQVGDASLRAHGTGLGLAIVRRLVAALGGQLAVDSATGRGSRFSVTLPLATADLPSLEPPPPWARPTGLAGPPPRALIVDDNADNRALLADLLTPLGFITSEAQDGLSSLDAVAAFKPDVILMDIVMPGIDGLEATRLIRAMRGHEATPIFVASASAQVTEQARSLESGATAFLPKPIDERLLFNLLGQHLSLSWITADPTPHTLDHHTAHRLDPLDLEALRALARQGDIDAILARLDAMHTHPEDAGAAEAIDRFRRLALDFEIDRLLIALG